MRHAVESKVIEQFSHDKELGHWFIKSILRLQNILIQGELLKLHEDRILAGDPEAKNSQTKQLLKLLEPSKYTYQTQIDEVNG